MSDDERLDDPDLIVASIEDARARRDQRNQQVDYSAVTEGYLGTVSTRDGSWLPEAGEGPTAREMLALHEAAREASLDGFPADEIEGDRTATSADAGEARLDAEATLETFSSERDDRARPRTEGLRGSAELAPQQRRRRSRAATRAVRGTARAAVPRGSQITTQPGGESTQERTRLPRRGRPRLVALLAVGVGAFCLVALHFGLASTPNRSSVGGASSVASTQRGLFGIEHASADQLIWRSDALAAALSTLTERPAHRHSTHPAAAGQTVHRTHKKHTPSTATHSTPPSNATSTQNTESHTSSNTKPVDPPAATPTQSPAQNQSQPASGCGGAGVLAPTNCGRPSL